MDNTGRNFFEGEALNFLSFFLTLFIEVCVSLSKALTACAAHGQDVLP